MKMYLLIKHDAMKVYRGVVAWLHAFLSSASRPGHFTPGVRAPGTYCMGGWVGPRAALDAVALMRSLY